jgi:hypothetical protein
MDEEASFEARAVLVPRRVRLSRLALVVPPVLLAALAWAGLNGPHANPATAAVAEPAATDATAVVAPSPSARGSTPAATQGAPAQQPPQVFGLDVHRLDEIQTPRLPRADVMAVAGWYVATTITDCPPLSALYRTNPVPGLRANADEWAYCKRSGVLYASPPDVQDSWSGSAGLPAIAVTFVDGVIAPPELESIGTGATQVVVLGWFVETADGCGSSIGCSRELLVGHVAWTPGA